MTTNLIVAELDEIVGRSLWPRDNYHMDIERCMEIILNKNCQKRIADCMKYAYNLQIKSRLYNLIPHIPIG